MSFLNILEKKGVVALSVDRLNGALNTAQKHIEEARGQVNLETIYSIIGSELLKINVSSLFGVYNNLDKKIVYKHYCAMPENLEFLKRKTHEGIRSFPIDFYDNYKNAILEKRPQFTIENYNDTLGIIDVDHTNNQPTVASIVVPLILRGEVIGVMELLSVRLSREHLSTVENFANILTRTIANTILFDEIKKSEAKYRSLIENAIDGVAIIDKSLNIKYANDAFINYFGIPREELNLKVIDNIHPEDRERVTKAIRRLLQGEYPHAMLEGRARNLAGEYSNYQASISALYEQGEVAGLQIFLRDINENIKLLETVENAKKHYEHVIDTIRDGLCVVDKDYRIISYNKVFAHKTKHQLKKLKGKSFNEVAARYDEGILKDYCVSLHDNNCIIHKTFNTRKPKKQNLTATDKFGSKKYYEIEAFPTLDDNREVSQAVIIFRDITDIMREQEKVRWLSEFNQRILDTAPISIAVLDKKGVVIAANGMARKLMDLPGSPIIGRELTKTKEIANNPELIKAYRGIIAEGSSLFYNNLAYTSEPDKTTKYLNLIAVPLYDESRKVESVLSMAIDNTEAVMAKNELEKLNIELEKKVIERTRELDISNKKLNQALDLKSKFISDASHELRTPLTVIQGNLDLAIREADLKKEKPLEALPLMMHEVQRINSILTDLTLLTNADQHAEQMAHESVNLSDLVTAAVQSLLVLANQKKIKLTGRNKSKKIIIMGDEAKLEKLILNILRNAIKYTDRKGSVVAWSEKDDQEARVIVQDTGIGISEKDLPFIFERFYRADKSRSRAEGGTGIGLSIAKWIAEEHGGEITVKSEIGAGTIFTVHLPFDFKKFHKIN